MQVDLILSSIKQILDNRRWLKAALDQVKTVYGDGDPPDPTRSTLVSDQIEIVLDDDANEIRILPEETTDQLDIRILRDNPIEETLEAQVNILDGDLSINIGESEETPDIAVDIKDEAEIIVLADESEESGSIKVDVGSDIQQFDENRISRRIEEIKHQIEENLQRIRELRSAQAEAANILVHNRDILTQQHSSALWQYDQQISIENQNYQSQHSYLQNQINEERTHLLEVQRRFWFRLLRLFGLGRIDDTQLRRLEDSKRQANMAYDIQLQQLQEQRHQTHSQYSQRRVMCEQAYQQQQQDLLYQLQTIYQATVNHLISEGQKLLDDWLRHLATQLQGWHPDWNSPTWLNQETDQLIKKTEQNPGLRIGILIYDNPVIPIPAIIDPIDNHRHVFIQGGDNDTLAMQMRVMLLRLLLAFPIGLTRVTLIDGVEQGRTLALFAAKLSEDICGGKVYDREGEIADELTKVRERISNINQHVLVEYNSVDSYNQANPELPSPYHFIIVSNFPRGFNNQALRALQDIVRNGPRAGVYVLATIAEASLYPPNFQLSDFVEGNYQLHVGNNGTVQWNSEYLDSYKAKKEPSLPDNAIADILSIVRQAYDKKPMVLKYERIARDLPPLWSIPTDTSLQTPIGLTFGGKLHTIEFSDEFVHGLIGGRTGMGKTVFLHDLICGLAQLHAPEDLAFYLLDFKGTEFNVYAKNKLPHARVIAVDCDVEVGLSIIKQLLQEIEKRRKLLNESDVPDIRHYREIGHRLPRLLLIIDEIQVLTQAADSNLVRQIENGLIDLLRRGRAMGIHILMGTQSPSSVLSNQMLQQMSIRVCLLADQQVSRLVLGEANEAASGLRKRGEAVFNAYNGAPDQNVFIRTALLGKDEIVKIVQQLNLQAQVNGYQAPKKLLYFDGKSQSSLLDHPLLITVLDGKYKPTSTLEVIVPLGNSIEIKEDTFVRFAREKYSNLAMVGSESELLHALLRNILVGLCVQQPLGSMLFYVIDLSFTGMPFAGVLPRAFQAMLHEFQFALNSQLGMELIEEVYETLNKRKEEAKIGNHSDQSVFLVIFGMENFSTLRGADKFDKPKPRRQFEEILADGPSLGIHAIVATQTLNKGIILDVREFGARVSFQVSEDNSRFLFESDIGSKLGRSDRAILRLYDWSFGKVEKFKPYLPLDEDIIRNIAAKLAQ